MFCTETRQPIAFMRQPGNIPDVISVTNAVKQLDGKWILPEFEKALCELSLPSRTSPNHPAYMAQPLPSCMASIGSAGGTGARRQRAKL